MFFTVRKTTRTETFSVSKLFTIPSDFKFQCLKKKKAKNKNQNQIMKAKGIVLNTPFRNIAFVYSVYLKKKKEHKGVFICLGSLSFCVY